MEASKLRELVKRYNACDISDALLKLKVAGAGYLPDILPLSAIKPPKDNTQEPNTPTAAPISTILFVPKSHPDSKANNTAYPEESNIPNDTHWTDLPKPNTVALIQQAPGQSCAVVGDILATRLKVRGVRGIVVDGRIRDLAAMAELAAGGGGGVGQGFQIWSKGTSTVGSGLEAQAWASDVPLTIGNVTVRPGDILFADAEERGVVVIPHDRLDALLDILPGIKAADDAVVEDVNAGSSVQDAFKKHRGA